MMRRATTRALAAAFALHIAPAAAMPSSNHIPLGSGSSLVLFPGENLYPDYIADPHAVGFGATLTGVVEKAIPQAGTNRTLLHLGGKLGLARHLNANGGSDYQIDLLAGFNGQFDNQYNQDNLGWDGVYGVAISGRRGQLHWKAAVHHRSAHVGDEYLLRTGASRTGYTREELNFGMAVAVDPHTTGYAEIGWGYSLLSGRQSPWRIQAGWQTEHTHVFWQDRLGLYAAVDLSAMEERDWRLDESVEIGTVMNTPERPWRLGVQYYDGPPTIAEFFRYNEKLVSLRLSTSI